LRFDPGSKVAQIYGAIQVQENYYCNFGVNPDVVQLLKKGTLQFVGSDSEGEIRVLELPDHPFFVGTLLSRKFAREPIALILSSPLFSGQWLRGECLDSEGT
jgi:CTP synthase (UTP-ammonia lyase)